jgi:hypothetical protein
MRVSRRRSRKKKPDNRMTIAVVVIVGFAVLGIAAFFVLGHGGVTTVSTRSSSSSSTTHSSGGPKYVILYINQGNGAVNQTNFGQMLAFASSQGFNTIFFQVYREGTLLFDSNQLGTFVLEAHDQSIKIFFSLYFTNGSQTIPTSIYGLGEDGISLDMSTLPESAQASLFDSLNQGYTSGLTAMTAEVPPPPLSPDLMVLETYGYPIQSYSQYIHPGVIAGVEAVAESSKADYQADYQYALSNSNGVMVFDYAGLMKTGY